MKATYFVKISSSALWILFSFLIGSTALCTFSILQKMSIGVPLASKGFIVPFLFGGVSGALLGILIKKYSAAAKNLRLLNTELENRVAQRTTELRSAFEQQKRDASFFQSSLDGLPSNIAILDEFGKIILVNKSWRDFAENNGVSAVIVSEGVNYLEICDLAEGKHSAEAAGFAEGIRLVLAGKESSITIEYPCHSPEKKRWFIGRITSFPKIGSGEPHAVISHEDITERKLMEQSITIERNRIVNILNGTAAGSWEWNIQTGETVFDERWAAIIGYHLEEISPVSIETWRQFTHPDDLKVSEELLEKHFKGESDNYTCEARMKHKNGDWVWVMDKGKVTSWTNDGKPLLMFGTHQDITTKKRTELELRLFKAIVDRSNMAIAVSDHVGQLYYINPAHEKLFGRTLDVAKKMNYRDFYPPESVKILNNEVAPTLERGEGWEGEMEALDANGRLFPLWERADSIPDEDGKLLFGFGIMHDISNRKEVEKQLKDSLREKETLLKEIHHRVKNNINIILALLKLQENNSKDPKLKSALKDSQNRLRTMSMIHEALYRTDNMSSINMKAYLEELGNTILSGYAGNENMRFHTSIEDIILSVKQASPIGLIINELITNSLKYAFPDERPKEIFLRMEQKKNAILLLYADSGIGLPTDQHELEKTGSLGLKLVRSIVENQFEGILKIENDNGAKFSIEIPIQNYHE